MAEKKTNKQLIICALACFIPVACYGVERVVNYLDLTDKTLSLVLAFVFTALTALLYFIVSRMTNSFYGMIASVLAFKMMPPPFTSLMVYSREGALLYSLISMAALVLFGSLIVKHFMVKKNSDKPMNALPIIALVFTMLILETPAYDLYMSAYILGGESLYGVYLAKALVYLWAIAIIYVTTIKSSSETIKFICVFQILAMSINIVRRLGTIVFCLFSGNHVSMSYYCWVIIYLAVMLLFAMLYRKNSKKAME